MKTLNDFFAVENSVYILSNNELTSVRGGVNPPSEPSNPYPPTDE